MSTYFFSVAYILSAMFLLNTKQGTFFVGKYTRYRKSVGEGPNIKDIYGPNSRKPTIRLPHTDFYAFNPYRKPQEEGLQKHAPKGMMHTFPANGELDCSICHYASSYYLW